MSDAVKPDENKDEGEHGEWFKSQSPEAQTHIIKLRKEAGDNRVAAKAAADEAKALKVQVAEYEAFKLKQATEQGDYKKLFEEQKSKFDALTPLEEKVKSFEKYFQSQLDAVLEGADESVKDLIKTSSKSVEEKIEIARKLVGDKDHSNSSPVTGRAGGAGLTEGDLIKQYQEAKTDAEKSLALTKIKNKYPSKYKDIFSHVGAV